MDQKHYTTKTSKQQIHRNVFFPLIEKENSTDSINLLGPPHLNSKYAIIRIFILQKTLDNIPISKNEIKICFFQSQKNCHWNYYETTKTNTPSLDILNLGINGEKNSES